MADARALEASLATEPAELDTAEAPDEAALEALEIELDAAPEAEETEFMEELMAEVMETEDPPAV